MELIIKFLPAFGVLALLFVFLKNTDKIRYTFVTSEQGDVYLLDRLGSTIKLVEK